VCVRACVVLGLHLVYFVVLVLLFGFVLCVVFLVGEEGCCFENVKGEKRRDGRFCLCLLEMVFKLINGFQG